MYDKQVTRYSVFTGIVVHYMDSSLVTTEIKYGLLGSKILFATSGTPYHWDFEFPNLHPEILPFFGQVRGWNLLIFEDSFD